MLRIAKRLDGTPEPYIGCRQHESVEDWRRIVRALRDAGVPARLLSAKSGGTGHADGASSGRGGFPDRPDGLGEDDPVPDEEITAWEERLWGESGLRYRKYLRARGLSDETIKTARLGLGAFAWAPKKRPQPRIVIPVFDADGICVNARLVSIRKSDRVKRMPLPHPELLNAEGTKYQTYGAPVRLYGIDELAASTKQPVYVFAGEFDRLLAKQAGLLALTATSGEKALPRKADAAYLAGRDVVVCYDCDKAGRTGAEKFARAAARDGAERVRIVDLDPERADGYDFADFITGAENNGEGVADVLERFEALVSSAPAYEPGADDDGGEAPPWERSDLGVADQVLYESKATLRYVPELAAWMGWDSEREVWQEYRKGDTAAPSRAIYKYCRRIRRELADAEEESAEEMWCKFVHDYLNTGRNIAAVRAMSMARQVRASINEIDARPELLNLANGTLNLETGELFDPAPDDLLTKRTNGAWLDTADPAQMNGGNGPVRGEWARFMKRFIPDRGTREWLQCAVGYSLLDGNPRRLLIILKGPGGTGKTTFAEILQRVLGPYAGPINLSLFRDSQDERPRADLIAAMTRRIVFASETSAAWKLHVDQLKRLTGNETIAARLPHSPKLFERRPAFTPWVLTNDTPTVDGVDMPFFRRLVVVPFHVVIPEAEEGADYVNDVLAGIKDEVMTWAVEGLWKYLDAGNKLPPKSKPMMLEEMEVREQFNSLTVFLAQHTVQGAEHRVTSTELYGEYENYCSLSGVHDRDRFNKIDFGRKLAKLGPYVAGRSNGDRIWKGLKLQKKT